MLEKIGLPGGGFAIGYGSNGLAGQPSPRIPQPGLPMGANATGAFIPVARVEDMLLNPGGAYDFNGEARTYPDIRMVYWCGGNPFHKQQDISRFLRAWQRPETIDGFGYDDCPGHPAWMEPAEWLGFDKAARHPLHMVSNQPRFRLHS
jgi:biotin/methionine sulfoxide reductase